MSGQLGSNDRLLEWEALIFAPEGSTPELVKSDRDETMIMAMGGADIEQVRATAEELSPS